MSVAVVVKVSEGLVLGTDSAAAIHGRVEADGGIQEGVLKVFYHAKKLLQIGDFPIGMCTWGRAFVGMRTIESLVREWERDNHWQSQVDYGNHNQEPFTVKACAEGLRRHLAEVYDREFGTDAAGQPVVGVVVGGYSSGEFFPDIWRFSVPTDQAVLNQRPDRDGKPDFGASWFGLTDAIIRLHWGRDDAIIDLISDRYSIPESELRAVLDRLQYQVPFAVMPLQDAIEYVNYMINVAIGRFRFVVGPELCGGSALVAAITQDRFAWASHEPWCVDGEGRHGTDSI
jgi:hypothetical protein